MSNVGEIIRSEFKRKDGVTERWGVRLWWQGKRHDLYKIPVFNGSLIPCQSDEAAKQLKIIINEDIMRGTFNPERYKRERKLHLEQYAKDWLKRQTHLSAATYHDYDNSIKNHIIPKPISKKYLGDIGSKDLEDFMKEIGRAPAGVQNVMGVLKKIFRDAKRWGDISVLPEFPVVSVPDAPHTWLEMEDQMKIVEHINEEDRPIFLFMMLTGCRPGEARAFRWQDINKDYIEFAVAFDRKEELKPPKNGEPDTFPRTDGLNELLKACPKNLSPFVFLYSKTRKPFTKNINRVWQNALKAANMPYVKMYNSTRHSFATQLANEGVEEAVVSRLLRHRDRRSTRKYYRYKVAPLKAAVDNVISMPEKAYRKVTVK